MCKQQPALKLRLWPVRQEWSLPRTLCVRARVCVRKSSTGCPRSARRAGKLQLCLGWRRSALCADGERFTWSIDFDSGGALLH